MDAVSNCTQRQKLSDQLSATEFVLYDLRLFLNTHPTCPDALTAYKKLVKEAKELRTKYESMYGPLQAEGYEPENCWGWIDGPWPWQDK